MLKTSRPAVILFNDDSAWQSCRTITGNLERVYRHAYSSRCKFYRISRKFCSDELAGIIEKIFAAQPDGLVFIDDSFPHPGPVILALHERFGKNLPPITVHVYGDFALVSNRWLVLEKRLTGTKIRFVCASPRQGKFVAQMMSGGERHVEVCPFPTDARIFFSDSGLRARQRRKLGLGDDDFMMIYSGRLTMQKNVLRLIQEVAAFSRTFTRGKIFLYLAGHFDDQGEPFDQTRIAGSFHRAYLSCLAALTANERERIRLAGQLTASQLNAYYNAADLFVSLSTYHSEDFGLAPVEALMSGCPTVLTDWGGYSGLNTTIDSSAFVPVRIDRKGIYFNSKNIQDALGGAAKRIETSATRSRRSAIFSGLFSVRAIADVAFRINRRPVPRFLGFSKKMQELSSRMRRHFRGQRPFEDGMTANSFYHKIFSSYMS